MDQYDDGFGLLKSAQYAAVEWPEFVKEAACFDEAGLARLPNSAFAFVDAEKRAFPIVDKGNTAISVMYFMRNGCAENMLQKTAARLVEACRHFGLEPNDSLEKIAEDGVPPEDVPTDVESTPENVTRAALFFEEKWATFEPPTRREICQELVKTAVDLGVETLPERVLSYASDSWNPEVVQQLEARRQFLRKNAATRQFVAVIDQFEKMAMLPNVDAEKFAEELYAFDKKAGLTRYYDTRLADSYAATFGLQEASSPDIEPNLVEAIQKFASCDYARRFLSEPFLEKLAADPTSFVRMPKLYQDVVLAGIGDILE